MSIEVRAGQRWQDQEKGSITVMAVADGYAMCRRRRRNPFIVSTDQMLRGEYGWTLVEDVVTAPLIVVLDEVISGMASVNGPEERAAIDLMLQVRNDAAELIKHQKHLRDGVNLLRELTDLEGPQPGNVDWYRKVQAFLGRVGDAP